MTRDEWLDIQLSDFPPYEPDQVERIRRIFESIRADKVASLQSVS